MRSFSLALAPLVLAPLAIGQGGAIGSNTALGNFDMQAQTGNNGGLGVTHAPNGNYYVSSRGLGGPPHQLYEFDSTGVLVQNIAQPVGTSGGAWCSADRY